MAGKKRAGTQWTGDFAKRIRIPKHLDAAAGQAYYHAEWVRKFDRLTSALRDGIGLRWPEDAQQIFIGFVGLAIPGFQMSADSRGPAKEWTPEKKLLLHEDYLTVKTKYQCNDIDAIRHLRTEQPHKAKWRKYTAKNLKSRLPEAKKEARKRALGLARALRDWNPQTR